MTRTPFGFGTAEGEVMQSAFVVADLDAAAMAWAKTMRAGPWFVFRHFVLEDLVFHGAPASLDISLALCFSGGICLELIQQHDETPSVYTDALGPGGTGFHHVAIGTTDYRGTIARLEDRDAPLVLDGRVAVGAAAGYADTRPLIGCHTEIIEVTTEVDALFSMIRQEAEGWNGKDPLREAPAP